MNDLFVYLTSLNGQNAYLIIFLILTACGIGLPLPEDIPLIAAGYLVWSQEVKAIPVFLIAMAGILIGDSLIFFLGRKLGESVVNSPKPIFRFAHPKKAQRAQQQFEQHGDKLVFFARFVAGVRVVTFFFAGVLKMPFGRFLFFDGLAALLSVPLWIVLGYYLGVYLGDKIDEILSSIKQYKHMFIIGLGVVLAAVFLTFLIKFIQASRQSK